MPARKAVTILAALAATALISPTARAQAALSPTTPAEIQPGHPPPPGSQTLTPAPLPPAAGADTPGGAARNGVIAPPAPAADAGINRGIPTGTPATPIIPPPGSPGGNPMIVPK